MAQKYFICNTSDLEEGQERKFKYKGRNAILVKHDGVFKAFIDHCPHAGGALEMSEGKLKCLTHCALFDPDTGCAESTPAQEGSSLMEIKLDIEGDKISYLNTIVFKSRNACEGHEFKRANVLL